MRDWEDSCFFIKQFSLLLINFWDNKGSLEKMLTFLIGNSKTKATMENVLASWFAKLKNLHKTQSSKIINFPHGVFYIRAKQKIPFSVI